MLRNGVFVLSVLVISSALGQTQADTDPRYIGWSRHSGYDYNRYYSNKTSYHHVYRFRAPRYGGYFYYADRYGRYWGRYDPRTGKFQTLRVDDRGDDLDAILEDKAFERAAPTPIRQARTPRNERPIGSPPSPDDGPRDKGRVPSAGERVVRVLLIGLTDDAKIGAFVEKSLPVTADMLRSELLESRLALTTIKGRKCTAELILQEIRKLGKQASADDTLLVYYLGHGAYDPNIAKGDPSGGHFLQLPDRDLPRKELFELILAQPGRLKILISDSCNVKALSKVPKKLVIEKVKATTTGPTGVEQLLLHYHGHLDVNASSKDEYSWFSIRFGGWFTFNFVNILPRHADWKKCLEELKSESNTFFVANQKSILANPADDIPDDVLEKLRQQKGMTPAVFRNTLQRDAVEEAASPHAERALTRVIRKLVD